MGKRTQMVKLKMNGVDRSFEGDPDNAAVVVLARLTRADRNKVWLPYGPLRRLHRA